MKYYSIGDIHGHLDRLNNILEHLNDYENIDLTKDKLVFTGDFIDRGPDSKGVIDKILGLRNEFKDNIVVLAGNHERMLLDYLNCQHNSACEERAMFQMNGGFNTFKSYIKATNEDEFYYDESANVMLVNAIYDAGHFDFFYNDLLAFYETDEYWFSHAPIATKSSSFLREDMTYEEYNDFVKKDEFSLFWTHHSRLYTVEGHYERDLGKLSICGHVVDGRRLRPRIYENRICYNDSGAGYPVGLLSCVRLENGSVTGIYMADSDKSWEMDVEDAREEIKGV